MGRGSTKGNENVYFVARKRAAMYNERLYSREGAAELLGISVSTLADYELGNTKVVPVDHEQERHRKCKEHLLQGERQPGVEKQYRRDVQENGAEKTVQAD